MATSPAVRLAGVSVRRGPRTILGPLDLAIAAGERWIVIGPNGSGKTTLLQVVSTYLWPSAGEVEVLGSVIGEVDSRDLRRRIGYAGSGLEAAIDPELTASDVVMTARLGALGPWWHEWTADDRERSAALLGRFGIAGLAGQAFGLLSAGERRRVQLARALMPVPNLLLLDEPTAGLDLGARELLIRDLAALAREPEPAAIVLVLHHVEEIPPGFGRALLLGAGRIVAVGPIAEVIADGPLRAAFGLPITVTRDGERFAARLAL